MIRDNFICIKNQFKTNLTGFNQYQFKTVKSKFVVLKTKFYFPLTNIYN